jgi:DnaK suppressor protein
MLVRTCEEDSAEAADMSSWLTFRISLMRQRSELLNELRQLPPSTSNEALDFPSVARRRFLERKVEEVNEALARIIDGTYGACVVCGMAIPIATLTRIPAASHCEACVAAHRADRPRAA